MQRKHLKRIEAIGHSADDARQSQSATFGDFSTLSPVHGAAAKEIVHLRKAELD